jgi:AraC-like DNA-binding protein
METPLTLYNLSTDCRLPHQKLQPLIEQYVYRKIIVPEGSCINKIMPLRSVSSIDFFLGNQFETIDFQTGLSVPFIRCTIRGPRTHILYSIRLTGEFISFTIKFKPTGLYRLLGTPMDSFTDKALNADVIEQIPLNKIADDLLNAPDLSYCIDIVEPYLLLLSEKGKTVPPIIEKAADLLEEQSQQLYPITQLANESYLSVRQLERSFIRYIGISPKTYYRMHRFLQLLQAKNNAPGEKWGSLAHEFGYYDQMHLVKEFKDFLKVTPSSFVLSDFAF